MKIYIFTLSADRVLVIRAENVRKAMEEVEVNWYPSAFDDPFSVQLATGDNLG